MMSPIEPEEECESCGVVTGGELEKSLSGYRGHMICYWCVGKWNYREKLAGHELSWKEFTTGRYKKRRRLNAK